MGDADQFLFASLVGGRQSAGDDWKQTPIVQQVFHFFADELWE